MFFLGKIRWLCCSFFPRLDAAKMTNVDEILKQQENDYSIREKLLLRRLAAKEQEVQEYVVSSLFLSTL